MLSIRYRRFIPAGAGNTQRAERERLMNPVYPRWRGEHELTARAPECSTGLSPLARGTRYQARAPPVMGRFIPAGAGNTRARHFTGPDNAVYPRWRGEHSGATCS